MALLLMFSCLKLVNDVIVVIVWKTFRGAGPIYGTFTGYYVFG